MVRASVVPEVTAVTVAVFTRFEAGKRVFFKSKYYIEEYDKNIRRDETRKGITGIVVV